MDGHREPADAKIHIQIRRGEMYFCSTLSRITLPHRGFIFFNSTACHFLFLLQRLQSLWRLGFFFSFCLSLKYLLNSCLFQSPHWSFFPFLSLSLSFLLVVLWGSDVGVIDTRSEPLPRGRPVWHHTLPLEGAETPSATVLSRSTVRFFFCCCCFCTLTLHLL